MKKVLGVIVAALALGALVAPSAANAYVTCNQHVVGGQVCSEECITYDDATGRRLGRVLVQYAC